MRNPITDVRYSNLKRAVVNIVANKTQLPRNEMKATISNVGDPQSIADIEEVVVTSTGEKGWCDQCDLLQIEVGLIHSREESVQKDLLSVKKELGLIRAGYHC